MSASGPVFGRRRFLQGGVAGVSGIAAGVMIESPSARSGDAPPAGHPHTDAAAGPGAPGSLHTGGLAAPLALAPDDVTFGWHVTDTRRGARQQAYRIVVWRAPATGAAPTTVSGPFVWDSRRVVSPDQSAIPYRGRALAPDAVYAWAVRTWDAHGRAGPFSEPATFETAMRDRDWRASWITRPASATAEPDQYTYARATVTLPASPIARARAYVAGDQQYELSVNGTRAGKGQAYAFPDRFYYETLDLTRLLVAGATNAVGMLTHWDGATKGHPAGRHAGIVQLSVHHADGSVTRFGTDAAWRVLPGAWAPGTQRDLEGDKVDYTENVVGPSQPTGWDMPEFDDGSWAPAKVLGPAGTAPWTHLVAARTQILESPMPAVSLTTLPSGSVVADFGKVYAAVPSVTFGAGTPGRTVHMHGGYLLDPDGSVSTTHGTQHTDMSYYYVQRGGDEEFRAFDYLGYRYFQVDAPGEPLAAEDVVARTRHAAVPDEYAGTFSSSDPRVDAVFELARHSALFTAQEQFVDTPTREKGPWLWDGASESRTAMAVLGDQNMARKSLLEFAESQSRYWHRSGAINKIYPTGLGAQDINESTEIYPEWVWQYWLRTGDRDLVASLYPVVSGVARYIARAVDKSTGLVTDLPSTDEFYVEPVVTRINVLGVNAFRIAANIAQIAGRPASEVSAHRNRSHALAAAVNARLTRRSGVYVDGLDGLGSPTGSASQDANACALAYGVVPPAHRATVAAYVARLGMSVEPRTAAEVVKALGLNGREHDLLERLTDPTADGWARILALGGTFTWEVWEPSDAAGDSMSHGWGSSVLPEIQRFLLGVHPTGPGFETFDVAPPATVLERAAGTVPTPRGPVEVSWDRSGGPGGAYVLALTVPPNATATVRVPGARLGKLTEGGIPVGKAAGVKVAGSGASGVSLRAGAGVYAFAADPP
jgi:alpha-L-rhamnosidase